ncbi:MAG: phosphoenolpyruvate--protein phosphotransferase [Synergistetes bacterium]|nr:phosphoenolpyruvate--protein phosphotransferase [Synergistota bacterium]
MVGIVVVSHSDKLAEGVVELAKQMTGGKEIPIRAAGGLDDGSLGTSFEKILNAINEVYSEDGVLILMDLGSAIMTTQMCVESLPEEMQAGIKLCNAPLVEGAVAAAAATAQGLSLDEVKKRAEEVPVIKVQGEEAPLPQKEKEASKGEVKSVEVQIINPTGLHARPSAIFVQLANKFKSKIIVQNITAGKPPADAKSVMEMAVNGTANKGEWIRISAQGEDAEEALKALKELVESGFGEVESESGRAESIDIQKEETITKGEFRGTPVYPGYVVAPAYVFFRRKKDSKKESKGSPEEELQKVKEAISLALKEIRGLKERISKEGDPKVAAIFDFHAMVLKDEKMLSQVESLIREKGASASEAISSVLEEWAEKLENQDTELMKERSADIRDIADRVLRILSGEGEFKFKIEGEDKVVLIAEELLPSETASLDRNLIAGIAVAQGGTTSHAAILARMWGIPSVVGLGSEVMKIPSGTRVALDGSEGKLIVNPPQDLIQVFERKREETEALEREFLAKAKEPAITLDEHGIEVVANVGNLETVSEILEFGAEGIGLLRTEFLFLNRSEMPSEEEQYVAYSRVAEIMGDKPVIIRTLDVGGDKPLSYIPMSREDNPFLGVRAIRLQKLYPDLLKSQIKAILRAGLKGNLKFMLPMVATLDEVRWAKEILEECKEELEKKGVDYSEKVEMGIMVEIPSAAIVSEHLAKEVAFFSIGTNDLTQYTLACDRGNKSLSYLFDSLNPAVLKLIKMVVEGAHACGKWVGVCGEMAGQKEAIPILVGMGVDELSMNARLIPPAKALIRRLRFSELKELAEEALNLGTAEEVRKLVGEKCEL